MRSRLYGALGALVTLGMLAGLVPTAGQAGAAPYSPYDTDADLVNVTNDDIRWASDDNGCFVEGWWELCVYFQHGSRTFARVVLDRGDELHRDGSLRLVTPERGDEVHLAHRPPERRQLVFADLHSGSVAMKVVSGDAAPSFRISVECPPGSAVEGQGFVYAGPYPRRGDGWQTIDLIQNGDALWRAGDAEQPQPLSQHQSLCEGGEIASMGFGLSSRGADTRVDMLRLNEQVTNFWIPPLERSWEYRPWTINADEERHRRLTAGYLARKQYRLARAWDQQSSDDWPNPARSRLPRAKAVVLTDDATFQNQLIAGPLANAVGGPVLLNPRGSVPFYISHLLGQLGPRTGRIYLVGSRAQLRPRVSEELRGQGFRVTRIGARAAAVRAVHAARIIERRGGQDAPPVVLADARRFPHSVSAPVAAGALEGALLLTQGRRLSPATQRYLDQHRRTSVYAVGPAAARALPGLPKSRKIAGANRYATAVKVARRFYPDPESTILAYGGRPTDALLGAAYAGRTGAPLLLMGQDRVPPVVARYLRSHSGELAGSVLAGDESGVSAEGFRRAFRLVDPH